MDLIVGKGIVGEALEKRINADIVDNDYEVIHICFPYGDRFIDEVISYTKQYNSRLVMIHSTILPGTTNRIYKQDIPVVYSPTIGRHSSLEMEYKLIASPSKKILNRAEKYLDKHNIKYSYFRSVKALELGKLLSTLYYGWCITFEKEVFALCKELDIDFSEAYMRFNHYYNRHYEDTDFVRPILKQVDGAISGTCVVPNAKLLQDFVPNVLSKFLLKRNKKWKQE